MKVYFAYLKTSRNTILFNDNVINKYLFEKKNNGKLINDKT
jgi:hypothetical protein